MKIENKVKKVEYNFSKKLNVIKIPKNQIIEKNKLLLDLTKELLKGWRKSQKNSYHQINN